MKRGRASLFAVACAAFVALPAPAYYHFFRYQSRVAPFNQAVEKFDLSALPGGTVQWFLSEKNLPALSAADSMTGLTSQINAAARAWNEVSTSSLRVGYGGTVPGDTTMTSPWIEVTFDELPPGLLAMAGPVTRGDQSEGPNGPFVPIVKSSLVLPKDLTGTRISGERIYMTLVHEFGHTLGLQHSWTSGAMSTEITRATTKAQPLAADDVAGLSVLYPTATFSQKTGSIAGRVTLEGSGAHLASVVALTPRGPAVSTLTLPDGTYRLDGLVPGDYFVYVHPLPPALPGEPEPVNLVLPQDNAGPVPPSGWFDLQFWPNGKLPLQTVPVQEGVATQSIDFSVNRRTSQEIHSIQSYSFYTDVAVKPAMLWRGAAAQSAILTGYGVVGEGGGLRPGVNISVFGSPEFFPKVAAYSVDNRYLQMDVSLTPETTEGHRHLLITSQNGEVHVVPSALRVVASRPPSIFSVTPGPERTMLVAGSNLSTATTVWFDGAKASNRGMEEGGLRVSLPAAANGHMATVAAFNPDGQSSLFLLGSSSPIHRFEEAEPAPLNISPSSLPAGGEAVVEITSNDGLFQGPSLSFGFQNSSVSVRRIFVVSPNRVLAQVAADRTALPATLKVTSLNGLQIKTGPQFFVQPAPVRNMYVSTAALPAVVSPGVLASLAVVNGPATGTATVTVNDQPATVLSYANGVVSFQAPAGAAAGYAIARITVNGESVLPSLVRVEVAPPEILGIFDLAGTAVNSVLANTLVQLHVRNLGEPVSPRVTSQLPDGSVVEHTYLMMQPTPGQTGVSSLYVYLAEVNGVTSLPLQVSNAGRTSAVFSVNYRP